MRQPLFGNTLITQPNGEMLGLERESTFFTWAKNEVSTIKDIWHYVKENWMTESQLKIKTRSRSIPTERAAVIPSIKWQPSGPDPPAIGDWVTYDTKSKIKHVYLIQKQLGRRFIGIQYHVLPTEEIQRSN